MKEILFRGKRVDNGEWVYGWYAPLVCNDKTVIPSIKDSNGSDWRVEPGTVGQFTGLCDKNGKKIFEGDIVESPRGTKGFIEWQNAECAFLVNIGDDWQTMDDCPYKVISNIYDDTEE